MEATLEPLLTVKEVAEYLRVCEKTIRKEIKQNNISTIKIGPKGSIVLIRLADVISYLDKCKVENKS